MNSPEPTTPNNGNIPSCPSVGWTVVWLILFPLINIIQLIHAIVYLVKTKKADIKPEGKAWAVVILSLIGIVVLPVLWYFFILYPSVIFGS